MIIKFIIKIQQKKAPVTPAVLVLKILIGNKKVKKRAELINKNRKINIERYFDVFLMGLKSSRSLYDLIVSVRLRAVHTVGLRLRFFIASKGLYGIQCKHWSVQMV